MSLHRSLLSPLCAFALGALGTAAAQTIDLGAKENAGLTIAWESSSPPPPGEGSEPEPLPGNETADPVAYTAAIEEPPLPEAEGPEVTTPTEYAPEEVAATPRSFRYAISVDVRGVYDDNVTLSSGANRKGDFYTAVMPQISFGLGDFEDRAENFVFLSYAPSGFFYFDNSDFSTIEQIGSLSGQWRLRRLTLTLSQEYQSVQSSNLNVANTGGGFSNQTNLDVGGRRRVTSYATRFGLSAPLTGKTSLRADASYSVSDPEGLIGSSNLSGGLGLDHTYGPKLSLGFGVTAGKQFVEEPSPDTTFQQMNVRATYELTGKMRASGSGGLEFRQSDDGTQNNFSPIFQLALAYAPFDGTQMDISATGRTQNSASAFGQDFTSMQIVFTARQRFLQRIFFSISLGVQNQSYFSTATGVSSERDDNYYFLAPGIDVRITEFWYAGLFYTHRENDSSLPIFSFDDNQYGIRTTLTF